MAITLSNRRLCKHFPQVKTLQDIYWLKDTILTFGLKAVVQASKLKQAIDIHEIREIANSIKAFGYNSTLEASTFPFVETGYNVFCIAEGIKYLGATRVGKIYTFKRAKSIFMISVIINNEIEKK